MSNLAVSATTTPYAGVTSTAGSSSSTTVSNTSSVTTKTVTSSTTPSSSTTTKQSVNVASSSNTATMSSSTTYAYGSSASNSTSKMVSSTTVYATSSSTTPNVTSSSTTPNVTSSSTTPQASSSSTTPMQLYSGETEDSSELDVAEDTIIDKAYTGNVSDTMKNLIQTEYEYMSDLEELSEHIEQEKQRIEALNSLKDEELFAGMSYEEIIQYRYENAVNEKCKALYEKYKDNIDVVEYYEEGDNRYNFVTNNVRINKIDDMKNETGYASTYFHEVGHCMDDCSDTLMGISGNITYGFYNALKSDYENFLDKVQEENGLTRDEAYVQISNWLYEDVDMKSSISDVLWCLSNGKIQGKYGHDEIWYPNSLVEKEAFADFFDAGMSYKTLKQMYIQEVFPNAHKVFEQMLTDELKKDDKESDWFVNTWIFAC